MHYTFHTSARSQTGRSVGNLLGLKVLPGGDNDESLCLANFWNEFVYISPLTINQKEMFDSDLRVTGTSPNDWKVTHMPAKEYYHEGVGQLQSGNHVRFVKLLYSRMFSQTWPATSRQRRA